METKTEQPVNERAAYLAALETRAKEVIAEIHQLACDAFKEPNKMPYVSVSSCTHKPAFYLSNGTFRIESESLLTALKAVELSQLAALKGGAK